MRPWLERLGEPSLERLNALAEEAGLRTESGRPVRFVEPWATDGYYEISVFESGRVATRAGNRHDFFNALAWLAFPRSKARINALHAAEIPRENGRRGRRRDLLTLLDEGGVIVECDDEALAGLVHGFQWKALFWTHRARLLAAMRLHVIGHAVLDMASDPWPGITCKAIFVRPSADVDASFCEWLGRLPAHATPRELPPLPVFGYPGWYPGSDTANFYDDTRYFRPFRRNAVVA